ncbi:MAG: hypothetical protein ACLQFR_03105 [Streptosporangiaceae bacterium]
MTRMNEAELATRTARLPEIFADRIPDAEIDGLRSMAQGGEWDELIDLLLAILLETRAAVSVSERDQLRDLLAGWGLPTRQLADLAVRR